MATKVSIVIPIHNMKNGAFFLWRVINSIMGQTYKNYEIIITKEGKMAENTNAGMKKATGDLIKVLYLDDWFAHKDALKNIVENFKGNWMITGANTNPHPRYTQDIHKGNNRLGSPSALTLRNGLNMYFDERLSWLLDCELYARLYDAFGLPTILDEVNINIGVGDHQMTHILTDEEKMYEHNLLNT